jgi:hypothetical protein
MEQVVGLDHHLDWKLEHLIISYAMYFQSLSNTKFLLPPNSYSLFGYDEQLVERVDYFALSTQR